MANELSFNIPEQLRKQIAEADAVREQVFGPEAKEGEQPEQVEEGQQPEGEQPPSEQRFEEGGQPEGEQTWEQRFRSQQGRLDQATRTNQQLSNRLRQMEETIAAMQARGAQPAPEQQPAPAPKAKLITEQEVADYGEDMLQVVGKRAREEISPELEQLASRLNSIENQVKGVGTVINKSQQRTVYETLTDVVPDWRTINKAPQFMDWLQAPDSYSGRIRKELLDDAFTRHDAQRVVAFFQGFLTEATGLPQQTPSPGNGAPPLAQQGNGSGRPSLEDFAAPGRARSAPQELPPDKPMYTAASINEFMEDRRRGKWRGREAQAEAIERDIFQAQHEGRIH